jgi:hypothetical protein
MESPLFLPDLLTRHGPGSAGVPAGECPPRRQDAGAPEGGSWEEVGLGHCLLLSVRTHVSLEAAGANAVKNWRDCFCQKHEGLVRSRR